MTSDPITTLLDDVHVMLEKMDWPTPMQIAQALDLLVADGPVASINLEPPPTIYLPTHLNGFRRAHTLAHEVAHALLKWREIDDELLAYYAEECAHSNLEALANHIAGIITIPPPVLKAAVKRYGFSPQTMIELAQQTGAPMWVSMDRVIFETDTYLRAALLFKHELLYDFASTIWLEAERYDVIRDPAERFPGIVLQPLSSGLVLGTWGE